MRRFCCDRCTSRVTPSFRSSYLRLCGDDPALFSGRFCDLVNSITEEAWKGPEEGDCDNETLEVTPPIQTRTVRSRPRFEDVYRTDTRDPADFSCCSSLQYDYEYDEHGERVVLGKGTFGVVYAGRDLSNQVRLAIKEIPERDSR